MNQSRGEVAVGEEASEARRGFSVLFMSPQLGICFDLNTGVPVVDAVRPVFTAPRSGDVLTAINVRTHPKIRFDSIRFDLI